jgi:hypothetical protein
MSYRVPGGSHYGVEAFMCGLVFVLVFGFGLANCFGPCDWLSWEPIADLPARCLPGMQK